MRCPSGTSKPCFFQKHPTNGLPDSVDRIELDERSGERATHLFVKSLEGVVALVQLGVVEFHVWGCRVDMLEKPDTLVFDLDPGPSVSWPQLIRGGLKLTERLEQLGLSVFTKLTGGKGIHLVVPLTRKHEWADVSAFARAVAEAHAHDEPARFTTASSKSQRQGRIFVDYMRNGRGATSIAPYSTRARPGAPIAAPIGWSELDPITTRPTRYSLETVQRRLAALRVNPWEGFESGRATITRRMRADVGL